MTREEQLSYCKVCKNQKFNMNNGIVCGLTNEIANFETTCDSYDENETLMLQQKEIKLTQKRASLEKRFLNYIIDIVSYYLLSIIVGVFIGIFLALVSPDTLDQIGEDNKLFNYIAGLIVILIYYTMFESATGRTIGKYLTKTKVVDENGNKPDFKTSLIRSLCRCIPFEPFSFLGSSGIGWHDKFSKTYVVNLK